MLLLTTASQSQIERFAHPNIGRLVQPRCFTTLGRTAERGFPWAADNDAFGTFDEPAFVRMLDAIAGIPGCLFVAAPDVVADADATLERFERWAPELADRGFPPALVLQDGVDPARLPWAQIPAVFVGGTDAFKLSERAVQAAQEAKRRGCWVHWGRVNSRQRIRFAASTGAADSFDGTGWSKWRDANLPDGLRWAAEVTAQQSFGL